MKLMLVPPPLVMEKLLKAHAVMPRPPEESNPVLPKTKPADCPGAQLALVIGLKLLSGSRTSDEPLVAPCAGGRRGTGIDASNTSVFHRRPRPAVQTRLFAGRRKIHSQLISI